MKHLSFHLLLVIAFLAMAQHASAQWTGNPNNTSPTKIYNNNLTTAKVGVGINLPLATLHVNGNSGSVGNRNFLVRYSAGGGLLNTEFSALTHLGTTTVGGNGWTALYAKSGAAATAGYFEGKVMVTAAASANNTLVNFGDSDGRHIFFTPKLGGGGYTWASLADDAGIFWSDNSGWNNNAGFVIAPQNGKWAGIRLAADGKTTMPGYNATVGVGLNKLGLGNAGGQNLGYGTSYLGFNAVRSETGGNWTFDTDGANNGGNVIWGDVGGKIHFATVASTGNSVQTPSDGAILTQTKMSIAADGKVVIGPDGTTTPGNFRLYVRDGIMTEQLTVSVYGLGFWPDYVFDDNYQLPSLDSVETFIQKEKHLPNVRSAQEMVDNGLDVAKTDAMLLRKIEETTLYLIEMKKEIKALQAENASLKTAISNR